MTRHWWLPIVFSAVLIALWELAVQITGVSPVIVPAPSRVIVVMIEKSPLFLLHSLTTALEVVVGFAFATLLGAALGVLIAVSPRVSAAIYPAIIAAQVMPKVAIAPLLIIWLGFGLGPAIALTTLIAFFPIAINTVVGMNMTRRESHYLFRSLGASSWQTFVKLRMPAAMPAFFGGLKVASTLAVIGAVVGEFMGANAGLGYILTVQVGTAATTEAFAAILYLTLLGLLFFLAVVLVERLVVPEHMLLRLSGMSSGAA